MDPNQPAQPSQAPVQPATSAPPANPNPTGPAAVPPPAASTPIASMKPTAQPQTQSATQLQTNQGATPNPPTPKPPTPSGPKKPLPVKKIIILVIMLVILGGIGFIATTALINAPEEATPSDDLVFEPEGTPIAGPREHVAQEYPDFAGVEVGEDTVAFNKVDESFRIRYRGQIFHEQDTGSYVPREVFPETADDFTWYGLVNAPSDLVDKNGEGDKLHSFRAPQITYQSFVFLMRWDDADGEQYPMYRFHNNQVELLKTFTKDRIFYLPILREFSPGGTFISIDLFRCGTPICTAEEPEVLLYHVTTGEEKNIGRVSEFKWAEEDSVYEYKPFNESVEPDQVPWRRNDFFVESVEILNI